MSAWAQKPGLVSITPEGTAGTARRRTCPRERWLGDVSAVGEACWGLAPHRGPDNTNTAHKDLLLADLLVC